MQLAEMNFGSTLCHRDATIATSNQKSCKARKCKEQVCMY